MGFRFVKNFVPIRKTLVSRRLRNNIILAVGALCPPVKSNIHSFPYFENPTFKISKCWHIGDSLHHDNHQDLNGSGEEGERIFCLGLAADVGLAAGKALTGYLSGSTAIIADAAHSVSDVVLSGVAVLSFKAARIPKDKEHPYGYSYSEFTSLGQLNWAFTCRLMCL